MVVAANIVTLSTNLDPLSVDGSEEMLFALQQGNMKTPLVNNGWLKMNPGGSEAAAKSRGDISLPRLLRP